MVNFNFTAMRLIYFSFLICFLGCFPMIPENSPAARTHTQLNKHNEFALEAKELDFLLGKWKRTNDKDSLRTYEYWKSITPVFFEGWSYTKSKSQIVWEEKTTLKKYHNRIVFNVKSAPGNSVNFYCSTMDKEDYLVCTNDKNEYPKKIEYWKEKDSLKARISGGGPVVDFNFIEDLIPE